MLDQRLRIAYLAPDMALLEHDHPVLSTMGHEVIVPKGADGAWTDVPDPGEPEHAPESFAPLRQRADCVIAGPDSEYLVPLIRGFDGPVVIRIVGRRSGKTTEDCLMEIGGDRLVSVCDKARGRVYIASTPSLLRSSREAGPLQIGFVPPGQDVSSHVLPRDVRFVFALDGDGLSAWDENAARWIAEKGRADEATNAELQDMATGLKDRGRTALVRVGPCLVVRPATRSTAPGICLHALGRGVPVVYGSRSALAGWLGAKEAGAVSDEGELNHLLSTLFEREDKASSLGRKISRRAAKSATTPGEAGWAPTGMQDFRQVSARRGVKRIAVVMPHDYRGGSIRAFKNVCQMMHRGAQAAGAAPEGTVEIVAVVPAERYDIHTEFADLFADGIAVRQFKYDLLAGDLAGGFRYTIRGHASLNDGINDLLDCDFLLFVSDRISFHLPPSMRYGMLNFDCLQRYFPEAVGKSFFDLQKQTILSVVRDAEFVAVTTPGAAEDFRSYFGVAPERVFRAPMFLDVEGLRGMRDRVRSSERARPAPYIAWATNPTPHKNHAVVIKALEIYYGQLEGTLEVRMCGAFTDQLRPGRPPGKNELPSVTATRALIEERSTVREKLRILGEISNSDYADLIVDATVVLNPSVYDNGSFSAMDGAYAGVSLVQSAQPANLYFDETFEMNSLFFDPYDPAALAAALKRAERGESKPGASAREKIEAADWRKVSGEFWGSMSRAIFAAAGVRA